ncbi:MAG TPA: SHOCT domain-containing protein [Pirellulales bacterium]
MPLGRGLTIPIDVIVLTVVALVLLVVAFAVAAAYYRRGAIPTTDAFDSLATFRELHARGELSDEEYRTIQSTLRSQLKEKIAADPKFGDKPHAVVGGPGSADDKTRS